MSNSTKGHRVAQEVREQILKRLKDDAIPVSQLAEEHGISTKTIYGWLAKGVTKQPTWQDISKMQKQNRELLALVGELTIKLSQAQKKI